MEPQQQQHKSADLQDGGSSGGKPSNYLCRQSSTRWTPTTDQIRILKDLYYNSGVRSPSADQIQKISARLRQYGKIEGKNVFYWFQNHKARERQKKRFTANTTPQNFSEHRLPLQRAPNIRYPGVSCPSSSAAGMVPVGQMAGGCGYGHMSMESNIRECAMACGNGGVCSFPGQGFQWAGSNLYPPSYSVLEGARSYTGNTADYEVQYQDEEEQEKAPELETLPLFPMHGGDPPASSSYCGTMMRGESENCYPTSCHWFSATDTVSTRTSLELSLNSYGDQWPNF